MAKTTSRMGFREVLVKQEVIDGINLELSLKEAAILKTILRKIGGSPDGPRGIAQGILNSICDWESQNKLCLEQYSYNVRGDHSLYFEK